MCRWSEKNSRMTAKKQKSVLSKMHFCSGVKKSCVTANFRVKKVKNSKNIVCDRGLNAYFVAVDLPVGHCLQPCS